jgi:hypothetical protein
MRNKFIEHFKSGNRNNSALEARVQPMDVPSLPLVLVQSGPGWLGRPSLIKAKAQRCQFMDERCGVIGPADVKRVLFAAVRDERESNEDVIEDAIVSFSFAEHPRGDPA